MSIDEDARNLEEAKKELVGNLYKVMNEWMKKDACIKDPELAMGYALGSMAEAAGDFSATYRFHNGLSDEWSSLCCYVIEKVFSNSHYGELKKLSQQHGNEEVIKNH